MQFEVGIFSHIEYSAEWMDGFGGQILLVI